LRSRECRQRATRLLAQVTVRWAAALPALLPPEAGVAALAPAGLAAQALAAALAQAADPARAQLLPPTDVTHYHRLRASAPAGSVRRQGLPPQSIATSRPQAYLEHSGSILGA
jgi:hypothetical protein